jgi:DNA-binding MurR/RpiR family transcriptional regulator
VTTNDLAPAPAHREQFLEAVRENLASFTSVELRIAKAMLNDPAGLINQSIGQFAVVAGVSAASAVRFCRAMGLAGFQELKLTLSRSAPSQPVRPATDVDAGDSPETASRKVVLGSAEALATAAGNIDHSAVAAAAGVLGEARRVLVAGIGTSAPLAADVAYRLALIGVDAVFPADAHVQHVMASHLTAGDACLVISHTGSTVETLAVAGAAVLAVTSFAGPPLTDISDLVVVAGSQETAYRVDAMTSRVVHLAVLDALVVVLAHSSPRRSETLASSNENLARGHRI